MKNRWADGLVGMLLIVASCLIMVMPQQAIRGIDYAFDVLVLGGGTNESVLETPL